MRSGWGRELWERCAFAMLAITLAVSVAGPGALAQDKPASAPPEPPAGAATENPSDEPQIKQIKLTEAQVKSFISAQPDLAQISGKLQEAGENLDPALQAEIDGIAKKHGFADFDELDAVAANISIVMAGLDTQTGAFTEPVEALKKELADVQADAAIPDADKKELVDELTEAIKTTPALEHKENIELVKTHHEEIEKALQ